MRRITFLERYVIELLVAKGKSHREIGRILGRDHRVVGREILRNTVDGKPYTAKIAVTLTAKREATRCRKKLEKDEPLRQFVVERLQEDFSPEQIAGLLKMEPPEHLSGVTLAHETIYQYVYTNEEARMEKLYIHLRKAKKKRKKRGTRKAQKIHIPERISIHDRPSLIAKKRRFGDFECDLVEGPRSEVEALSVHYERKSQLVRLQRVKNKTAEETLQALRLTLELLPEGFMQSVTFDNGSETTKHIVLRYEHNIETYHCDPYSSWQKGGVENMNGLIRQYIPKGAKISSYTDIELREIERRLNTRPRKSLNYKTPLEVLAREGWGIRN